MRRRFFIVVVFTSLVLWIGTAALWLRSHQTADTWRWSGSKGELREVTLMPGEVRFATAPWGGTESEHLTSYNPNRGVIYSRWSSGKTTLGIGFHQFTDSILVGFQGARPTEGGDTVLFFMDDGTPFTIQMGPEISRNLVVNVITIRFPLLLLMFSLAPLSFVATRLFARRVRAGFCRACGYDLRATPGRCPECGAIPESTSQDTAK